MAALGTKSGPKMPQKRVFPKVIVVDLGCSTKYLARFQPMVTSFGPWKVPKFLENGPFWDQKGVKSESKVGHC